MALKRAVAKLGGVQPHGDGHSRVECLGVKGPTRESYQDTESNWMHLRSKAPREDAVAWLRMAATKDMAVHKDLQSWQRTRFGLTCDQIWQFRLANAGKIPRRNSDDAEESRLARALAKLRMRAHGHIGAGTFPSMKQLSSVDAQYFHSTLHRPLTPRTNAKSKLINDPSDIAASRASNQNLGASRQEDGTASTGKGKRRRKQQATVDPKRKTLDGPCGAPVSYPSDLAARKIGKEVLAWQALQGCQRIPYAKSHDKHEKKLGKSFQDVLRRRYRAIGVLPCRQQLSADVVHFINGIPGVPHCGCSVNAAARSAEMAPIPGATIASSSTKRRRTKSSPTESYDQGFNADKALTGVLTHCCDWSKELCKELSKELGQELVRMLEELCRLSVATAPASSLPCCTTMSLTKYSESEMILNN